MSKNGLNNEINVVNEKWTKSAFQQWLVDLTSWDYFITLNPEIAEIGNKTYISPSFLQQSASFVKQFHAHMDKNLLGKHWHKKDPVNERTFLVAFPEIGSKGDLLHWHGFIRVPNIRKKCRYTKIATNAYYTAWTASFGASRKYVRQNDRYYEYDEYGEVSSIPINKKEKMGHLYIVPFEKGSAFYSSKTFCSKYGLENYIISTDFSQ